MVSKPCRFTIRSLALAALTVLCSSAQIPAAKPLSVCEVLAQLPALNGKEISVRGIWVANDHGQWLVPPGRKCPQDLVSEGFVWYNSIHLFWDKKYDPDSRFNGLLQKAEAVWPKSVPSSIIVTYVGTIETRVPPVVVHYPDGSVTGYGFGHLDGSPAKLTYKRVTDVVLVEEKPEERPDAPKTP